MTKKELQNKLENGLGYLEEAKDLLKFYESIGLKVGSPLHAAKFNQKLMAEKMIKEATEELKKNKP